MDAVTNENPKFDIYTQALINGVLMQQKRKNIFFNIIGLFIVFFCMGVFFYLNSYMYSFENDQNVKEKNSILTKFIQKKANSIFSNKPLEIKIDGLKFFSSKVVTDEMRKTGSIVAIYEYLDRLDIFDYILVKRFFPNKILIFVKEREFIAVAEYKDFERSLLVDKNGKISFNIDTDLTSQSLPVVKNMESNEVFIDLYRHLDSKFIKNEIESFDIIGNRRCDILLKNGVIIKMPKENIEEAVEALNYLVQNFNITQTNTDVKYIDLRLSEKVYIGYKDSSF
jgi:cell division septal protein FtsQ